MTVALGFLPSVTLILKKKKKKNIYIYVCMYFFSNVYIVYGIESAAYGVIFTSCLCQNPNERGLLTQTTSEYNPVQSNFYAVNCLLHVTREFSLK